MKKLILLTLAVVTTLTLSAQNHKGKHETKSDKKKVAKKSTEAVTTQKPTPVPGIGAVIQFPTTSHDFGTVEEGVRATFEFEFTNTGDSDLILTNVQASCGCTVPTGLVNQLNRVKKIKLQLFTILLVDRAISINQLLLPQI